MEKELLKLKEDYIKKIRAACSVNYTHKAKGIDALKEMKQNMTKAGKIPDKANRIAKEFNKEINSKKYNKLADDLRQRTYDDFVEEAQKIVKDKLTEWAR